MNYKKIKIFECDDNEIFKTEDEAKNHCRDMDLRNDYISSVLCDYIEFHELHDDWTSAEITEAINILTRIRDIK